MKLRCNQAILSRLVSLAMFIGRSILLGNLSLPSPPHYSACFLLTALALEMCLEKWFRFETATADSYSHIKVGTDCIVDIVCSLLELFNVDSLFSCNHSPS